MLTANKNEETEKGQAMIPLYCIVDRKPIPEERIRRGTILGLRVRTELEESLSEIVRELPDLVREAEMRGRDSAAAQQHRKRF